MERISWTDERIDDMVERIEHSIDLLRTDIRDLRTEMREMRAELHADIGSLRRQMVTMVLGVNGVLVAALVTLALARA